MNTKQKLHQLHLNEWTSRFSQQKSSGLSVRQWCDQNHYSIHTYNYWKHLLKEELASQVLPDIVPLQVPGIPALLQSAVPVSPAGTLDPNLTNCAIRHVRATATLTAIIEQKYHMNLFVPNTLFLFCGNPLPGLRECSGKGMDSCF